MTIFERVIELAKQKNLSLREIESKAGIAEKALYKWKTYNPRVENVQKVADVLGVSVDYLLGNTDDKKTSTVESEGTKNTIEDIKKNLVSYDGRPVTDHDAKLIKQYLDTLFEGRD